MLIAIIVGLFTWYEAAATSAHGPIQSSATVPGLTGPPAQARLSLAHAKNQASRQTTVLAAIRFTTPRYSAPGVRESGQVPATWWGVPSVLPVVATRPGWVEVRLAQRPNGSTSWLPDSAVRLSSTGYRIVIDLTVMRLRLYQDGTQLLSAPAGIGTKDDPTPTGHYFVAFDEPPPVPNPGYGPFILVTSAHSPAIGDWEGSGDAVIGIHGPLGEDSEIGTTGARISHGCLRLHDKDLVRLRQVPPGTPIDIIR
jgi:lipoprotein-anchoring transpeptidase ErfK/SrfK